MMLPIDTGFLLIASPFVVISLTILPVHLAFVAVVEEQFFQSSSVVHCSPYHSAIRHSTPDVAVPVVAVVVAELALAVVEASQRTHLPQLLAAVLVAEAEVVAAGAALSAELLFVTAVAVVVAELFEIVDAVDILE